MAIFARGEVKTIYLFQYSKEQNHQKHIIERRKDQPGLHNILHQNRNSAKSFKKVKANPDDCGTNPDDYSTNPDECNTNPDDYSTNPEECSTNPDDCNTNTDDCITNPDDCSANPDDFRTNPNFCNKEMKRA